MSLTSDSSSNANLPPDSNQPQASSQPAASAGGHRFQPQPSSTQINAPSRGDVEEGATCINLQPYQERLMTLSESPKTRLCMGIAHVLEQMFQDHQPSPAGNVSFPPLTHLAHFFDGSQMDVYEALQILRKKGYDYLLTSMDHPIALWRI
jgi:hypothetical protein